MKLTDLKEMLLTAKHENKLLIKAKSKNKFPAAAISL
jgi:hypothetical protein